MNFFHRERGMVTPLVASSICLLLFCGILSLQFLLNVAKLGEIQNKADLAAIAAAEVLQRSGDAFLACVEVEKIYPVEESRCKVEGEKVEVVMEKTPSFLSAAKRIKVRAVAGPIP